MKGKVINTYSGSKSNPDNSSSLNPHSYEIKGEDGETYFAHMGDIKSNTEILYQIANEEIARLVKGDNVVFEPRAERKRAINIIKES